MGWIVVLALVVAVLEVVVVPLRVVGGEPMLHALVVAAGVVFVVVLRWRAGPREPGASV